MGIHALQAAHNRCGRVAPSTSTNAGASLSTRGVVHASQNTSPHPRQWCLGSIGKVVNARPQSWHSRASLYGVQAPLTLARIVCFRALPVLVDVPCHRLGHCTSLSLQFHQIICRPQGTFSCGPAAVLALPVAVPVTASGTVTVTVTVLSRSGAPMAGKWKCPR